MTQEELANRLGYKSRSAISKIESGENNLTQTKVANFAAVLKTTPSFLMGYEESEKKEPIEKDEFTRNRAEFIKLIQEISDEEFERLAKIVDLVLDETSK